MPSDDNFREVVSLAELEETGRHATAVDGTPVALFAHDGEVSCVGLSCPHMGFPLTEGSVEDGVLTCHWHHARFELDCGGTFDPWADDVPAYPVLVEDGVVYVDPDPPRDETPAERWTRRLEDGLEQNLRLVLAKSSIGLLDADVDFADPVGTGVRFGTRYRETGWGPGLTVLAALTNVAPDLAPDDRKRALYQGLVEVAGDCAGEAPRFDQDPFDADVPFERLQEWFRDAVEVRDADGAERCLRTAVRAGHDDAALAGMLCAAATDHRYLDSGHTMDFVNKACEALDRVGWDRADEVLPTLVTALTDADRAEERSSWRQPVDLAGVLDEAFDELPDLVASGDGSTWTRPDGFGEALLDDDPRVVVDALSDAIAAGATVTELADAVAYAAGTRVAQFATVNEFSDWNTVHHTFTYANAVHQLARRTETPELYRGVFDAAINVYLDRFLNSPAADIPARGDADADPAALLDDLSDTFDREGAVNDAGRAAAHFLDAGGAPGALRRRLGAALLREDAGFHTFQALEAGFAQYALRDDDAERRTMLVAVARYLAAHSPTRREREQTFTIAARLARGEAIHAAAEVDAVHADD